MYSSRSAEEKFEIQSSRRTGLCLEWTTGCLVCYGVNEKGAKPFAIREVEVRGSQEQRRKSK